MLVLVVDEDAAVGAHQREDESAIHDRHDVVQEESQLQIQQGRILHTQIGKH